MSEVKYYQSIGQNSVIVSASINRAPVEIFLIKEEIDKGFYITSNKGVDTRQNLFYLSSIESAIRHIKQIFRSR